MLGAIKGDYMNVFIKTNFRTLPAGCKAVGCHWPQVPGAEGPKSVPGPVDADGPTVPRDPPTLLPPTDSPMPGAPGADGPRTERGPGVTVSGGTVPDTGDAVPDVSDVPEREPGRSRDSTEGG